MISGAGVSESHLGWADKGIMGYRENVEVCRMLASLSEDLLLQADADTGYGNAVNVNFTVKGFENAGVAAVMIEDQVWPKRCGHLAGKSVIPAEEMVQKIKSAVDAKRDPDFIIKARTDAAGPLGINAAIDTQRTLKLAQRFFSQTLFCLRRILVTWHQMCQSLSG